MKSRQLQHFAFGMVLLLILVFSGCRREVPPPPPPPPPPPMPSSGMLREPGNGEAAWNSNVRWSSHHHRLALIERRGVRSL
ncbi:MAG: hypothetical protein HY651_06935 [Acidobacteria bacterium]|nr:hypothetical protein [Acidobacteriota bacterium]